MTLGAAVDGAITEIVSGSDVSISFYVFIFSLSNLNIHYID